MTEYRFKAYISYSHKDEAWGRWLQRALESYHLPRHLVGKATSVGEVPERINPVFRDREDLSSANDLKDTVKKALADSENLIVVCSPDAAQSHWVNEEIREFARLGKVGRIFGIIVGGEPAANGSVSACFPKALEEIGVYEPLAADVRKWADGKRIAKLKLIAGLLGIRLDELRQRDLQRRRKRQVMAGLGIAAAIILAVLTLIARVSEKQEREKAEQLATFIVDLGERLKTDADLETLALISDEAARHLQNLDPNKLSPATGQRVALALRQVGRVNELEGKPQEALIAFQRSRDLLAGLHEKYPDVSHLLFELGNAEYYIGNLHNQQNRYESALKSVQNYHRLTVKLLESDPSNPEWMLEVSYSNNNLAAVQLANGKGVDDATLEHVAQAIYWMEKVVALKPGDQAVADVYSTTLAWASDAELSACNLDLAMGFRKKAEELVRLSSQLDPGNNALKTHHAFALTGISRLQVLMGQAGLAEHNMNQAISILKQLVAVDPSNVFYQQELVYRQNMLLGLMAATGQLEKASALILELDPILGLSTSGNARDSEAQKEHMEFLMSVARVEFELGNTESAYQHARAALTQQSSLSAPDTIDIFASYRLARAASLVWQISGEGPSDTLPAVPGRDEVTSFKLRGCFEAETAARFYMIEGDRSRAALEIAYLQSKGFKDPGFLRFCRHYGLCDR